MIVLEKPKFLYHGSAHKVLKELQPQGKSHRAEEGELLYATQNLVAASIFLIGGVHYGCGRFGDVWYTWIIADRDDFIEDGYNNLLVGEH